MPKNGASHAIKLIFSNYQPHEQRQQKKGIDKPTH